MLSSFVMDVVSLLFIRLKIVQPKMTREDSSVVFVMFIVENLTNAYFDWLLLHYLQAVLTDVCATGSTNVLY